MNAQEETPHDAVTHKTPHSTQVSTEFNGYTGKPITIHFTAFNLFGNYADANRKYEYYKQQHNLCKYSIPWISIRNSKTKLASFLKSP